MKIILFTILSINLFAQTTITKDGSKTDPVKDLATILNAKEQEELKSTYVKGADTDEETAIRMLTLDLAPFVKTLDRDIVTYNYREKNVVKLHKAWLTDTESKEGIEYANNWAGAVNKHTPDESGMVGYGLYSSNNLESSSDYANSYDDFALIAVKYAKDSKMLDIRKEGSQIPISSKTLEFLKGICGHISSGYSDFRDGTTHRAVHKSSLTHDKKCNDIFIKVLSKLGISGMLYNWRENLPNKCSNSDRSAFVAVNLKLDESTIDTYTNLPVENLAKLDEKSFKKQLLDRAKSNNMNWFTEEDFKKYQKQYVNFNMYSSHQFRKAFKGFKPSDVEIAKYEDEILKETFGCDKKYAKQDAPHYDPNQALKYIVAEGLIDLDINKDLEGKLKSCQL